MFLLRGKSKPFTDSIGYSITQRLATGYSCHEPDFSTKPLYPSIPINQTRHRWHIYEPKLVRGGHPRNASPAPTIIQEG